MHITLCGPVDTQRLEALTGEKLAGAPPGLGGTPVNELAAGLLRLGHKVSIATTDHTISNNVAVSSGRLNVVYCPLRAGPTYRARERALDMFDKEIKSLTSVITSFSADIVHAHWTYEFAEAAVRSHLPHIVTMHDLGWEYLLLFRDPYRVMRLLMKYRVMPRVHHLTVVAPFMAKKAWQYGYFGHVDVVPNGITVPAPIKASEPRGPDWSPKIFAIGDEGRIKNVRAAIKAFRLLRKSYPQGELHLYGPGLDERYVNGEYGVFGHGKVDQGELMARLQSDATVLIHPSRLETFGMIIIEAKARGVPIVGGQASGGVPFVCGNAGAIITDIENPKAIAGAVAALLSSPEKLEIERYKARADFEARFDNDKVTQMYVDIYKRVLNDQPGLRVQ